MNDKEENKEVAEIKEMEKIEEQKEEKKEESKFPIVKIKYFNVKRELKGEEKRLFKLAYRMKKKKPAFLRQEYWKLKRLRKAKWRKPRGIDSKLRVGKKGQGNLVKVGYRKPKLVRNLHPSGFIPVLIRDIKQLENIDNTKQAIIISAKFGRKKRNEIIKIANEKKIVILNPRKGEI
ncbi:MAG: 50S ribosomal protein L32e [Candidatus Altarchaeaceae archaeon]